MERFSVNVRSALGGANLLRAALGIVLVVVLVWALPVRRPGEEGGHHAAHAPDLALDAFEKAGVTELKEGQRGPAFRLAGLDGREGGLATWADKAIVLNFWAT